MNLNYFYYIWEMFVKLFWKKKGSLSVLSFSYFIKKLFDLDSEGK